MQLQSTICPWTNQLDQFVNVARAHGSFVSIKESTLRAVRNGGPQRRFTEGGGTPLLSLLNFELLRAKADYARER
jgi:hypothetical protein